MVMGERLAGLAMVMPSRERAVSPLGLRCQDPNGSKPVISTFIGISSFGGYPMLVPVYQSLLQYYKSQWRHGAHGWMEYCGCKCCALPVNVSLPPPHPALPIGRQ